MLCKWDKSVSLGNWIWPYTLKLNYTAWAFEAFAIDCGYEGPPYRWDEDRRFLLCCELDATYFHLYGISYDDVDYILETFSIMKRKDETQYSDFRTKRVILEIYDEMQRSRRVRHIGRGWTRLRLMRRMGTVECRGVNKG